jgi:hypothetical protein
MESVAIDYIDSNGGLTALTLSRRRILRRVAKS